MTEYGKWVESAQFQARIMISKNRRTRVYGNYPNVYTLSVRPKDHQYPMMYYIVNKNLPQYLIRKLLEVFEENWATPAFRVQARDYNADLSKIITRWAPNKSFKRG